MSLFTFCFTTFLKTNPAFAFFPEKESRKRDIDAVYITMGYDIDVEGAFEIDAPLEPHIVKMITEFSNAHNSYWEYDEDSCTLGFPEQWHGTTDIEGTLVYIVKSILQPDGYIVNGTIDWYCPEEREHNRIDVYHNVLVISNMEEVAVPVRIYDATNPHDYESYHYETSTQVEKCNGNDVACSCSEKTVASLLPFLNAIIAVHPNADFHSGKLKDAYQECLKSIRVACHGSYKNKYLSDLENPLDENDSDNENDSDDDNEAKKARK